MRAIVYIGIIVISAVFVENNTFAQALRQIPVDFDQINKALIIRNPAFVLESHQHHFQSGYKGFNSLSKNIRTFYGDLMTKLGDSTRGHTIGVHVFNDQEGLYIRQNRTYARYAYQLQLSERFRTSLGIGLGAVNYQILGNAATGGLSDTKFDSRIGVGMNYSSLWVYGSMLQFLDEELTLGRGTLELKRYYQVLTKYKFDLGVYWQLEPGVFIRYAKDFESDIRLYVKAKHSTSFYSELIWNYGLGLTLVTGWDEFYTGGYQWSLGLSYRSYVYSELVRPQGNIELSL